MSSLQKKPTRLSIHNVHSQDLYTHEVIFGLFLLLTWLRLVFNEGLLGHDTLVFLLQLFVALGLVHYDLKSASNTSFRWRMAFYPIAMNISFQQLRSAVPAFTSQRFDISLRAIDSTLLGDTPSVLWQGLVTPGLTELMSLFYLFFFPYLLMGILSHLFGPAWRCKAFMSGLFSLYGIGFIGYTLVPAAGPYLAWSGVFQTSLTGGSLTTWNDAIVKAGSIGVDVFPSLHVAVSSFILGFDFRHNRRRFWICLLPCVGLWCSTLYLRYHYFIDVICGAMLASWALWIARRNTTLTEELS